MLSSSLAQQLTDETFMRQAAKLAEKGVGFVSPNPLVGAVVVKAGKIVSTGWHAKYGEMHAEARALWEAGEAARGATLYCTLEPCCHQGKQPPCTELIKKSGIARVVIGSPDPNPLVAGKGEKFLREVGIEVTTDCLRGECDALNPIFFHYIRTQRPYVALKYAMSLDGKIATSSGISKWITGEEARAYVHRLRHRYKAILVGRTTVEVDDPLLTARFPDAAQPIRIVLDSQLRISLQAKLVETAAEIPTVVATGKLSLSDAKAAKLEAKGVQLLATKLRDDGKIEISDLLRKLGEQGIDSLFVEGGAKTHWSFIENGAVNKIYAFMAPQIIGGAGARSPVEGKGFLDLQSNMKLMNIEARKVGTDILLSGEVAQRYSAAEREEN